MFSCSKRYEARAATFDRTDARLQSAVDMDVTPDPTCYRRLRATPRGMLVTRLFLSTCQNAFASCPAVVNWKLRFALPFGRLLPWDWSAVIPGALRSSRVTREINSTLFSVDWGKKGDKPRRLQLWSHNSSGLPLSLEAANGIPEVGYSWV